MKILEGFNLNTHTFGAGPNSFDRAVRSKAPPEDAARLVRLGRADEDDQVLLQLLHLLVVLVGERQQALEDAHRREALLLPDMRQNVREGGRPQVTREQPALGQAEASFESRGVEEVETRMRVA